MFLRGIRAKHPIQCRACKRLFLPEQIIVNHHVSYFPEKIVQVHKSCHSRIHVGKTMYQDLRPDPRQTVRWYRNLGQSYFHSSDASEETIIKFFHSVNYGFLTPEKEEWLRRERARLEAKEYWNEVYRTKEIQRKLQMNQDWNSYEGNVEPIWYKKVYGLIERV